MTTWCTIFCFLIWSWARILSSISSANKSASYPSFWHHVGTTMPFLPPMTGNDLYHLFMVICRMVYSCCWHSWVAPQDYSRWLISSCRIGAVGSASWVHDSIHDRCKSWKPVNCKRIKPHPQHPERNYLYIFNVPKWICPSQLVYGWHHWYNPCSLG